MGATFDVEPPRGFEAELHAATAEDLARHRAGSKGSEVAMRHAGSNVVVLAADTVVSVDDEVLGKPADSGEALRFLRILQGRTHVTCTAYSIFDCLGNRQIIGIGQARVSIRALSEQEMKAYVASQEPFDKAGGYAIQGLGALLVERISGDYYAVVGLPLCEVAIQLAGFGVDLLH